MNKRRSLILLLIKRIRLLEKTVLVQRRRLAVLFAQSIHSMEVDQDNRIQNETVRRSIMSDLDFRHDLEIQYGKTRWANRLIDEILVKRMEARESEDAA